MLTPETVHYGRELDVLQKRHAALEVAYQAHPERFKGNPPKLATLPNTVWINKPIQTNNEAQSNQEI